MRLAVASTLVAFACATATAAAIPEIVHVAGKDGVVAALGDTGPATQASIDPMAIDEMRAGDGASELKWAVADYANCRIRLIQGSAPDYYTGTITTAAGNDCSVVDNRYPTPTDATQTSTRIGKPTAVAVYPGGGTLMPLLFASGPNTATRVHMWTAGDGLTVPPKVQSIAGGTNPCSPVAPADGAVAYDATLCDVRALDAHYSIGGRFLIADARYDAITCDSDARVYEAYLDAGTWKLKSVAGGSGASEARCLREPTGVLWLNSTEFLVADRRGGGPVASTGQILKFSTAATTSAPVVVASGLDDPTHLTKLEDGRVIFAESGTCRVRRLESTNASATITEIAGSVCGAATPDSPPRPANTAVLPRPFGVHMAPNGLLITDPTANRIWMVDRSAFTATPPTFTNQSQATVGAEAIDEPTFLRYCQLHKNGELVYDNQSEGAAPCVFPMTFNITEGNYEFWHRIHGEPAFDKTAWTVDQTAPSPPTPLSPVAGAAGLGTDVGFEWQPAADPSGIDRHEVWVGGAKAFECDGCTSTSLTVPEGDHQWFVRAVDNAGNPVSSAARSFSAGTAPTAAFSVSPNPVLAGRTVTFDAAASSDTHGPIARYEWDLDGNGDFETDGGSSPVATRSYPTPGSIQVGLRVTDGAGKTATTSVELRVNNPPPATGQFGVSINKGAQYTRSPDVVVNAIFPAATTQMLFSNDGGFFAPGMFAPRAETRWRLDSSGPERLPKTIYVRFLVGGLVSETHQDDIILDETPPRVESASIVPPAGVASISALRAWRLRLRASDSNSGVKGVQVAESKRKPGRLLRYRRTLTVRSAARPKWVRARDHAGNNSRWRRLR